MVTECWVQTPSSVHLRDVTFNCSHTASLREVSELCKLHAPTHTETKQSSQLAVQIKSQKAWRRTWRHRDESNVPRLWSRAESRASERAGRQQCNKWITTLDRTRCRPPASYSTHICHRRRPAYSHTIGLTRCYMVRLSSTQPSALSS